MDTQQQQSSNISLSPPPLAASNFTPRRRASVGGTVTATPSSMSSSAAFQVSGSNASLSSSLRPPSTIVPQDPIDTNNNTGSNMSSSNPLARSTGTNDLPPHIDVPFNMNNSIEGDASFLVPRSHPQAASGSSDNTDQAVSIALGLTNATATEALSSTLLESEFSLSQSDLQPLLPPRHWFFGWFMDANLEDEYTVFVADTIVMCVVIWLIVMLSDIFYTIPQQDVSYGWSTTVALINVAWLTFLVLFLMLNHKGWLPFLYPSSMNEEQRNKRRGWLHLIMTTLPVAVPLLYLRTYENEVIEVHRLLRDYNTTSDVAINISTLSNISNATVPPANMSYLSPEEVRARTIDTLDTTQGLIIFSVLFKGKFPATLLNALFAFFCTYVSLLFVTDTPPDTSRQIATRAALDALIFIGSLIFGRYYETYLRDSFLLFHRTVETTKAVKKLNQQMGNLLSAMLPATVIQRLSSGESTICDSVGQASVSFSDVVGFTSWCRSRSGGEVVAMMNNLTTAFDRHAAKLKVLKIKTIGDAYWAVSGVPDPCIDCAHRLVSFNLQQLEIVEVMNEHYPQYGGNLQIRIGCHTGPLVGGVIGTKQISYEVFGETSDQAQWLEQHSDAGCLLISAATKEAIDETLKQNNDAQRPKKIGVEDKLLVPNMIFSRYEFSTDTPPPTQLQRFDADGTETMVAVFKVSRPAVECEEEVLRLMAPSRTPAQGNLELESRISEREDFDVVSQKLEDLQIIDFEIDDVEEESQLFSLENPNHERVLQQLGFKMNQSLDGYESPFVSMADDTMQSPSAKTVVSRSDAMTGTTTSTIPTEHQTSRTEASRHHNPLGLSMTKEDLSRSLTSSVGSGRWRADTIRSLLGDQGSLSHPPSTSTSTMEDVDATQKTSMGLSDDLQHALMKVRHMNFVSCFCFGPQVKEPASSAIEESAEPTAVLFQHEGDIQRFKNFTNSDRAALYVAGPIAFVCFALAWVIGILIEFGIPTAETVPSLVMLVVMGGCSAAAGSLANQQSMTRRGTLTHFLVMSLLQILFFFSIVLLPKGTMMRSTIEMGAINLTELTLFTMCPADLGTLMYGLRAMVSAAVCFVGTEVSSVLVGRYLLFVFCVLIGHHFILKPLDLQRYFVAVVAAQAKSETRRQEGLLRALLTSTAPAHAVTTMLDMMSLPPHQRGLTTDFPNATVCFCRIDVDVVQETSSRATLDIWEMVHATHVNAERTLKQFPLVVKIKTVGSTLIVAGGLREGASAEELTEAAYQVVQFAIAVVKPNHHDANSVDPDGVPPCATRSGVHTGELQAAILGVSRLTYDIFGTTVNMASRCASTARDGTAQLSVETFEIICGALPREHSLASHGAKETRQMKGLGSVPVFVVAK